MTYSHSESGTSSKSDNAFDEDDEAKVQCLPRQPSLHHHYHQSDAADDGDHRPLTVG